MKEITDIKTCRNCGDQKRLCRLVRNITISGVSQVYWYCINGKHMKRSGEFISHEKLVDSGYDPDDLPVIHNYSGAELCEVCQNPGVELHHFAPRHLFGNDADKWPAEYLCKKHHKQWHDLVTPEMTRRKNGI